MTNPEYLTKIALRNEGEIKTVLDDQQNLIRFIGNKFHYKDIYRVFHEKALWNWDRILDQHEKMKSAGNKDKNLFY